MLAHCLSLDFGREGLLGEFSLQNGVLMGAEDGSGALLDGFEEADGFKCLSVRLWLLFCHFGVLHRC